MLGDKLPWKWLLGLALVFTLLNCFKPLQVDDAAYYYYARQAAEHPLDPYGFAILWYDEPEPANHVLAPPVLPYWWSLAIRLFGDVPFLWKLWLLPFSVLFVGALHVLCRRFARGLERPLVVLVVLSPAILPSLNLMLDVPALALGLGAVVLFMRSVDQGSWLAAAGAGLLAGLAMQTKYTGFLAPVTMGLYTVVQTRPFFWREHGGAVVLLRRFGLQVVAVALAVGLFVGWEMFIADRYGESHFLYALEQQPKPKPILAEDWAELGALGVTLGGLADKVLDKSGLAGPLLSLLGVSWPLAVLGLAALRLPRFVVVVAAVLALAGYGLIAASDREFQQAWHADSTVMAVTEEVKYLEPEDAVFGIQGAAIALVMAGVACRVVRLSKVLRRRRAWWRPGRDDWFLILWLGLEVAGYFALTPFPSVRRTLGIVVVGTLLAGRLASRTCRSRNGKRWIWGVASFGTVLGLAVAALDFYEAYAIQRAAEEGAALARQQGGKGTTWYVGHWGFQFYAERAGMKPVMRWYYPEETSVPLPQFTVFQDGDRIVLPDTNFPAGGLHSQGYRRDPERTELLAEQTWDDDIPLRTVHYFYGGRMPLGHRSTPRRTLEIYRVTRNHCAR